VAACGSKNEGLEVQTPVLVKTDVFQYVVSCLVDLKTRDWRFRRLY